MSTLTKEWLQKTIAELEEERDAVPGVVNEDAAMALAAMKIALASLEAESVAFRSKLKPPSSIGSEHWDYTDHRQPDAFELESCVIERLFTEPPAPVAVPAGYRLQPISEYDAMCSAMLQGVENAETLTTMQTASALDSSPKIAESPTGINQGKSEPVTTAYKLPEPIKDNRLNSGEEADDYYSGYQAGWNECLETVQVIYEGKPDAK
ncbi:hypothetical protein CS900_18755 [Enterobacter hormaechei]|uniref:hypothetical protein n=1 Tax=Enterobacter hormaechei TaxID=158836 RepID=UPI0007355F5B|nr:hypothetical protein [Enterobacter hormaechei]KTG91551.1 hypothetical protein ASV35_19520 [Enterobacter hormaechei subsp. steigerwaltii]KVJ78449.1 hypothetical protein AWS26_18680 [Enterobacter hormaechei subsp. steigerwaltii]MCU3533632.1 hypothetical protein [Enterobacter hormaechei subsp. steigerwaltii]MDX7027823.1 hypothetical protein [Enterobacter hormaechei]PHZ97749.1 hypothetical protein CS900_18755 [Enterobacter hormaechei]